MKKNKVKTWSLSSLHGYETCPQKWYEERFGGRPRQSSPALERGVAVHAKAEQYLLGNITGMPKDLAMFTTEFVNLKKFGAIPEEQWCLDRHWQPVEDGWTKPETWLRAMGDARVDNWICDFKGLPLGTPIPTPTGWTTMGDTKVGDNVFDMDGEVVSITGKSKVKHLNTYRITFDDTTNIDCDEEHLWRLHDGSVKIVTELRVTDEIPVAKPVELPEANLPVAPYLLGHWLGDGRCERAEITSNGDDADEIIAWLRDHGEKVDHVYGDSRGNNVACYTPVNLIGRLRSLGLLGNKHIPMAYLRGSVNQRMDLMCGLMDSDGTANSFRKQAVFCNSDEQLIDDVFELAASLGQRPLKSTYTYEGFGKTGTAYRVSFRPQYFNPFLLKRKADLMKWLEWGAAKSDKRKIRSIDLVESVPSQCIEVDSPTSTYLCGKQFCVTHNTGRQYADKHKDQANLYANILMCYEPTFDEVDVEFWYLDSGKTASYTFYRTSLEADIERWEARVSRMFRDKHFLPSENQYCKWCPLNESCELFK